MEHIVELYKWIETLDTPGGITREYREVSSEEFNQLEEYEDFFFVGWTLPSMHWVPLYLNGYLASVQDV